MYPAPDRIQYLEMSVSGNNACRKDIIACVLICPVLHSHFLVILNSPPLLLSTVGGPVVCAFKSLSLFVCVFVGLFVCL